MELNKVLVEKQKSLYDFPIESEPDNSLELEPTIYIWKHAVDPIKQMIDKIDLKVECDK